MKHSDEDQGWVFADARNVAVFTTCHVMRLNHPVLHVSHDDDDGAWQFHTGERQVEQSDSMIVALEEMVAHDPTLCELADLPYGWIAEREGVGKPWMRMKR